MAAEPEQPAVTTATDTAMQDLMPEDPFAKFTGLASHDTLKAVKGRVKCPRCEAKRKFFCYDCFLPLCDLPNFTLPIRVEIIHWPTEMLSKSTAVHAKILCPDSVGFHEFPEFPDFDPDDYLLAYPSDDAMLLSEVDPSTYKGVVFIDSQWQKAGKVESEPRVAALRKVKIASHNTLFWRYQSVGPECLATIEAIYYVVRDNVAASNGGVYDGSVDNLLYLFSYMYKIIQNTYIEEGTELKRIPGFVKFPENAVKDNKPTRAARQRKEMRAKRRADRRPEGPLAGKDSDKPATPPPS